MGWSTTTLGKTEEGFGVRNLRNAKCALMAKNVFMALNCEDKLWIHISNLKYGTFHCWNTSNAKKCF